MRPPVLLAAVGLLGALLWAATFVERSGVDQITVTTTGVVPLAPTEPVSLGQTLNAAGELVALVDVDVETTHLVGTIRSELVGSAGVSGAEVRIALPEPWTVDASLSSVWVLLADPLSPDDIDAVALAVLGRRSEGTVEVIIPSVDVPITALDPTMSPLTIIETWVSANGVPSPHVPTDLQIRYRMASASAEVATP